MNNKVKVIPCSGIGKAYGLISREAALTAVNKICPDKAESVCLAYIMTGDDEVKEKILGSDCITIDGCPKMCASKNVTLGGGNVVAELKVLDTVKEHKGKKFGNATSLSEDGELVVIDLTKKIVEKINLIK